MAPITNEPGPAVLKYTIPAKPWPERLGNHRAVITIQRPSEAVRLQLLWRRHDRAPEQKQFMIVNGSTGDTAANLLRLQVNNEQCDIVFGPIKTPGEYFFYYLLYEVQEGWGWFSKDYLKPESSPDTTWVNRNGLNLASIPTSIPSVVCTEIQSRTEFDSFFPMEVIATKGEKEALFGSLKGSYLLFPEDRKYPIRMQDDIPSRWINRKMEEPFVGEALRNEYYAFQIGLLAVEKRLENVTVRLSDLTSSSGPVIPASALTCFNTGGMSASGKPFTKVVNVERGKVQALWLGIDIPAGIVPGVYDGVVTISPANDQAQAVKIRVNVKPDVIADRGDGEPWRHSRLRWLNSTLGIDDNVVAPFVPVKVNDDSIRCLGREIVLDSTGLPGQINSWGHDLLASPIRFILMMNDGAPKLGQPDLQFIDKTPGRVSWVSKRSNEDMYVVVRGEMEFDGHITYRVQCTARKEIAARDLRLELPMKVEYAELMMGMSRPGGAVPVQHDSKWTRIEDSFWFGNASCGIQCELRGASYNGPMLNLYKPDPPETWSNSGKGGFRIRRERNAVVASAYSGDRILKPGETITFEFALIVTPVKQVDYRSQFLDRYYHNGADPIPSKEDITAGVRIVNLHHANKFNPYINYPFIAQSELKGFVDACHVKGLKVKIYYTVRELTNHVTEIWALRSLGNEVLAPGPGGGFPWLREHLIDNYTWQWYQHWDDTGLADAALLTSGESRWYNYYIEGLGWLVKNMGVDGLYLDDVTYDRNILKRMRKVMELNKPGCIIDLHSNTGFSKGPANQYLEFFPYVDKLWFGESFQYDEMSPENWLVEVSGIPFGLMGDMLQGGGNRWRGMLYGMTVRHPWVTDTVTCDPRPVWKVWDAFGIQDSRMIGYWEKGNPVNTSDPDIKATVYQKLGRGLEGKVLIALASWADHAVDVSLSIDWSKLSISPVTARIVAPEIKDYQRGQVFSVGSTFTLQPKRGLLLIIESMR